ncbi:MAG: dihydroorotate dehydrogenase [Muribaculaceae bacterium]|nr:dihydroorotate dehydrogenase [Muribaculaceae bacterium]
MMGINLNVDLGGGLTLDNPVLTASGTFGFGHQYSEFIDLNRLGGFIVKGTTLEPRQGNPAPRLVETPSGMINAVGLQNPGVECFARDIYPTLTDFESKVIVNISGAQISDYVQVAEILAPLEKVSAIEVNISCPNVKGGGMSFGTSPEMAAEVTSAIRRVWPRHMMVKLTPNVTSVVDIAQAVEDAGADSVSLINTFLAMSIDVERRKACLSTITGGLSGPAIRPIAVRMVWQVARAVNIPVVGLGGIMDASDALQFIMAGATAVQVGTANFIDPAASVKVVEGIEDYCERHNISDINELRGII